MVFTIVHTWRINTVQTLVLTWAAAITDVEGDAASVAVGDDVDNDHVSTTISSQFKVL